MLTTPTSLPTLDASPLKGKWAYALLPTVPPGMTSRPSGAPEAASILSGDNLLVADYSKNKDLAFALVKLMTDDQNAKNYWEKMGQPPTNATTAQTVLSDPKLVPVLDAAKKSVATPFTGAWGSTRSAGGTATATVAVPGPPGAPPGRTRGGRRRGVTERQRPLWLLIPGGFLMTLIILIPLALAVYISLTDLDQYTLRRWIEAPFIGLKNYADAFGAGLGHSIWLSVSFAVISTIVTIPLGVAAALVTQNPYRGRAVVRAVFLIPYVLPSFVVAEVWRTMLQPDGIVTSALTKVGVHPGLFLSGPKSYWTLVLVEIWAAWPFIYLMALAALQGVDVEVQEAAATDGATWWPKLRHIIIPYLQAPVALAALLATLNHINNFTLPFVLFGVPAPDNVNVLPTLVYVTSFQSLQFGLSAAMAIVSLLLIAFPLFVYLRAVRLDVGEEGARR
jgi:multiple sugar transport system permease protein